MQNIMQKYNRLKIELRFIIQILTKFYSSKYDLIISNPPYINLNLDLIYLDKGV